MGGAASKTSRSAAAGAAKRKYPTRPPPTSAQTRVPPPAGREPAATPQKPQGTTRSARIEQEQAGVSASKSEGKFPRPFTSASYVKLTVSAIDLDGRDPDLAMRLRRVGPVPDAVAHSPNQPPVSTGRGPPSSTTAASTPEPDSIFRNPALVILQARRDIEAAALAEFDATGRRDFEGRTVLDAPSIQQALIMRERGNTEAQIEERFLLKKGVLRGLGPKGAITSPGA